MNDIKKAIHILSKLPRPERAVVFFLGEENRIKKKLLDSVSEVSTSESNHKFSQLCGINVYDAKDKYHINYLHVIEKYDIIHLIDDDSITTLRAEDIRKVFNVDKIRDFLFIRPPTYSPLRSIFEENE